MASTTAAAPGDPGDGKKKRKRGARAFQRSPLKGYNPAPAWYGWGSAALDGSPVFLWPDVPRMLRDPQIRFVERMWRAPFQKVKWSVTASNKAVAQFVGAMLRRFWVRSLPKLLSRYFRYGFAPGAAEFAPIRGRVRLVKVRAVEPLDAQARVWSDEHERAGELAGFDVAPHGALAPNQLKGNLTICSPHLFWFSGHGDLTQFHDAPPLAGCFEPWLEKRGRGGAIQSRKLWFRKAAWRGGILYYPEGPSNVGPAENPQYVDNQDLARQALETLEAGGTMAISSDVNPATNQKKWEYQPPESYSDVAGLREYPQDLDREILVGAGIPPEVLEASEVGSGWSGRMVPLMGYLGTIDELAGLLLEACDSWLGPLVQLNFGENAWYEVKPLSLVDELQQQQQQGGAPGGGQPGITPSNLFDGKPPQGGPGGPSGGGDGPQQPGGPGGGPLSLSVTIPEDLIRKAERAAGGHKYACAHVDVPRELAAHLKTLAYTIPNTDLYDPANGKGRELESHVTVRFGLLTDEAADLAPIAADAPPARVSFTGIGHFDGAAEGKPYDVVFAAVDSADLRRLNRELAALPHHDTHPEYVPHATIAYVRAGTGALWARRLTALASNLTGRDFTAPALVLSARDSSKEEVPFGANAGPRELSWGARGPLELGWTEYKGPKGGAGWVSDTGEVRYQEAKPGDDEANPGVGLESVFAHPDFAHVPSDGSDVGAVRAEYHDKAAADGLDPAELHRRAADQTERWARRAIEDEPELMPAGRAVAHLTKQHAYWADRVATAKAEAESHRAQAEVYEKNAQQNPTRAEGWRAAAEPYRTAQAAAEKRRAEAEPIAASYLAELEKAKAGHVVQPIARARLARRAYDQAHAEMSRERADKEFAGDFADRYFEQDDPKKRATAFAKALTGGDLDPALLPEDARAAVAEDLAHLPPNKLAALAVEVATNWGWAKDDGTPDEAATPFHKAIELAAQGKRPKPVPFDATEPGDYVLYHDDRAGRDLMDAARALSRTVAPAAAAKFAGDNVLVVKKGSALHKALSEHDDGIDLDDSDALQMLFAGAKSEPMLAQGDAPASARDYGGTSGSKGTGEFKPEADWNPNAVATYRRISDDVFVRQRASGDSDSEPFELVHRKDVPDLTRLPAPYWEGLRDEGDTDEDDEQAAQRRAEKASETGAAQKRSIADWKADIRERQGAARKLRDEWNRALAGVPEDERPEEPDWDGPDASALTDQHDTREDHETALQSLHDDYDSHVGDLQSEVEAARQHADEYRARNAGHAAARQEHVAAWNDADAKIQEQLSRYQEARQKYALPDLALNDELAKATGKWRESIVDTAADDDADAHLQAISEALDDIDSGESPDHAEEPFDPADYAEHADAELPADDDGTPEELADLAEAAAERHADNADGLRAEVESHVADLPEASRKWRASVRRDLDAARERVREALALPEDVLTADDGRAALEALAAQLDAYAKKVAGEGPRELSATVGPDGGDPDAMVAGQTNRLMRQKKAQLARALAVAMVRVQLGAAESGDPASAAPKLQQLAALAGGAQQQQPQQRAAPVNSDEGVTVGPLELSWEPYLGKRGARAGVQVGWKDTETGQVRYQKSKPGEHAEKRQNRQASEERGREILRAVARKEATAAELGELVDHLPVMSVKALKSAKVMLDAKFGQGRTHRDMVNTLLARVGGLTAADGTRADGTKGETGAKAAQPAGPPQPGEVRTVPTDSLKVDPGRFQFKLGTNKEGVTKELQGVTTYNPEFAGTVLAWRDPADGKDYVVNGHHRHELAKRTGHPDMAVRWIAAKDAREARAKGALVNIAEGRGTAVDAAKFMRDAGVSPDDLARHGVSLKGKLAADAATLTKLNDKAFDRLARGGLDLERALSVARHLSDPARQERLFDLLAKREEAGKDLSGRTVEELARQMAAAPKVSKTESTLWGDETTDEDTFVERAELAGYVRAQLAQEANDFGAVASQRRADRVAGAGNTLNVEENAARQSAADELRSHYDGRAHLKGGVSDALDAGAVKLKTAKSKKERERVRSETLEAVRQAVRGELDALRKPAKPDDGRGESGVDQVGGGTGAAERPAPGAEDGARPAVEPTGVAEPRERDPNAPKIEYVRASAGGQVSEVDGKFYRGGQLMPVHGKYSGMEKPPKGDGIGAASGPASPDSDGGEGGGGRNSPRLSPEEAAERRAQLESQDKARTFQNGPLGKLTSINNRTGMPRTGTRGGIGFKPWQDFAQQVGEENLKRIADSLPPPADAAAREDYDFQLNHPQDFKATQPKKHAREFPSSADARFAVQYALENAKTPEDVQKIHDLLTGANSPPETSRASATSPALPNAAGATGGAAWMPGAQTARKPAEEAKPEAAPVPEAAPHGAKPEDIPYDRAYNAHRNSSFVPEVRAKQRQEEYVRQMAADWDHLSQYAKTPEQQEALRAEFERYRNDYRDRKLAMLDAASRTASSMITGPARFPTEKNRQRLETESKRRDELIEFRKRALNAIRKKVAPEEGAIQSNNPEAIQLLQKQLADLQSRHELTKQANAVVRAHVASAERDGGPVTFKAGKTREGAIAALQSLGLSPEESAEFLKSDYMGRVGEPAYAIQNRSANMRRIQGRIEELQKLRATPAKEEQYSGGVRVSEDPDAARIRIHFPGKPDAATIAKLKSGGFRWSPSEGAWQRHLNNGGRYAVESMLRQLGHEKQAASAVAPPSEPPADVPELLPTQSEQPEDAPAPQPDTGTATAPEQPSAAPDYSKFDALLRTSNDRAQAEQIARATGVPVRPEAAASLPAKGNYAEWLRGTDPAALKAAAGSPAVDRAELLAAVQQVYGDAVHAEAKKKSKQGIAELLAGAKPLPKPGG